MEQDQSPEINPHIYSQLIFDKEAKDTQWGKERFFSKWCWETWIFICKRIKLDFYLRTTTKINPKRFKDLNVRPETIKLLEDIGLHNNVSGYDAKSTNNKSKNKQVDYIKLQSFYRAKETINTSNRQPTEWEEIFASHISDKGLISKIYKELIQFNSKNNNNNDLILKWAENLSRYFSK